MSANADFSILLKCLASGKKSIEQLRPTAPRQTSALELLVVYCFHILLEYPCALYYGMLILSRALGACPTPLAYAYKTVWTLLFDSTCHDVRRNALTGNDSEKISNVQNTNQCTITETRKEGLKSYVDLTIYTIDPAMLVPTVCHHNCLQLSRPHEHSALCDPSFSLQ